MTVLSKPRLDSSKSWQTITSAVVILIGGSVLLGWLFNIPALKSVLPGLASMKANTAFSFLLVGITLWILRDEPLTPFRRRVAQILTLAVFLIGILTLSEYLFGWDLGIDQLLFTAVGTSAVSFPGRMAEATAFSLILLSLALWLTSRNERVTLAQCFALLVAGIGLFAFAGYLYGASELYNFPLFSAIALHTSVGLFLSGISLLLLRPQRGLAAVITTESSGGLMARRLLPAAIIAPVVIGWLRLKGQESGLYGTDLGLTLFALSNIVLFTALIWWNAHLLNDTDDERKRSAQRIRKLNRTLAVLSDINQAIVRIRSVPSLYERVCEIAVQTGEFRMIWIGLIDPVTQTLTLAAHAGTSDAYVDGLKLTLSDEARSQALVSGLRHSESHIVFNDFQNYPNITPEQRETAALLDYQSLALLPLFVSGELRGVISLCAKERNFFDAEELKLLDEMAGDIAFAMEFAAQEAQREQAQTALLDSESRYHRALDSLLEGAEIIGFDWRYLYVNDTSASHGRLSKEVLLSSKVTELYPGIEDTEMFASLRTCMEERTAQHFETEFAFPDGTKTWFDLSVQPVPEGIFILSLDITERKRTEISLKRYAQRMEILHQIDTGILQGDSIQALVEATLKPLRQLIPCQRANVGIVDPTTGEGIIFAVDFQGETALGQGMRVAVPSGFFDGYDARHLRVFDDLRSLEESMPRSRQIISEGLLSGLNVLLMERDQPIGTLGLMADTVGFFTVEYQEIAAEVGNQLAIAIRQLQLTEEIARHTAELERNNADLRRTESTIKRYATRMEILHTIDVGIIGGDAIPALVEATLRHLRQIIPCQRAGVLVFDETTGEALIFANNLDGDSNFKQGMRVPLPAEFFASDEARQALAFDDIGMDETSPRLKQLASEGIVSSLNLPLMDQDRPIGSLGLLANTPAFFTSEYQEIAGEVANQLAIAIRQMQLTEENVHHTTELEQNVRTIGNMRQFLQTTLDVLSAGIAVLDPDGTIINVNDAWERFSEQNGGLSESAYLHSNYLTICDTAVEPLSAEAAPAAAGIRAVISGQQSDFYLEYPCDAPIQRRWFGMRVTAFSEPTPHRVVVAHTDITQRKLAEEALQEVNANLEQRVLDRTLELNQAKERVEAILNNSTSGILLVDADLHIRQTNPAFNGLFGKRLDNTFGQSLLNFIDAEDAGLLIEIIQMVIREQAGQRVELRCVREDGTTFDAEFSIGYFAQEARREGIVCIIQDISERKRSEAILRESEGKFRSLVEAAPIATVITDQTGVITLVNHQSENLFGYTSAELVGQPVETLLPQNVRERHIQFRAGFVQMPRVRPMGLGLELFAHRKEGSDLPVEVDLSYVETELGLLVITFIVDITERKERERQLLFNASLQEAVRDAVIATDLNYHIQSWNPAAERIYGWAAWEVMGKLLADVLQTEFTSGESRERVMRDFLENGFWTDEVIQYHKDGHAIDILTSTVLFKDAGGQPFGVVIVNHDITERKRAEQSLHESETRYRLLANSINDVVMRFTPTFDYLYVSPSSRNVLGYEPEELLGRSDFQRIHPDDVPATQELVRRLMEHPGSASITYRFRHKQGHYIWLENSGRAVVSEQTGEVVEFVFSARDVTARKAAEEAVRNSEARYRLLADNITDMVTRVDAAGVYVYVSPSTRTLLGYKPEELIGKSSFELIHPADIGELISRQSAASDPNVTMSPSTYRVRHKAGHYIWVETSGQVIWSADKANLLGYITVSRDISERKRAAEALALSEQHYTLLINGVNDYAIYVLDPEGHIISWNPGAEFIKGYTASEILGQHFSRFYTPEDIALGLPQTVLSIAEREGHYVGEGWRVRKDDSRFWAEVAVTSLRDSENNLIGFTKITRDLTERKRIENALLEQRDFLQLVVDSVPGLVIVKDREGRFQLVNNMLAQVYGVAPADMIGKTDAEFNANREEVAFFAEKDQETLNSGQPVFIPEETLLDRTYQTSKIPLQQSDGSYDRLLVVASDITERKNAEEALRRALSQEKELGELKSRFVSMASHEFRTPLATILAAAETLSAYRSKMTEAQIDHRINNIREQVDHLKNIIEDVLQLARIQAGRLDFTPVVFDLDGLCRSVIDEFQSRPDITHQLIYSCDPVLREVKLDKKLIRQLINNLVSNAVKYSPEAGKVFITLEYKDQSIVLSVRDQGIGIPESDLKHLFEPFHRATNVGTISGTGLGLSITKEAVELHGGTIQVDSQVGNGTTVIVTIPVSTKVESDHDENPVY